MFFFFKQKTAYEIRISDWSSDVCSSDLELILQKVFGAIGHDNYRDYIQNIHESGNHLLTIINDILDVSKAEAGMIDLYEEEVDLREVIASGMRLIGPRARDGRIALKTDYAEPLCMVTADARRLKQILINLDRKS